MPASLFYRKNETMGISGLPFDLFISEKHKMTFKVGDHPLQNGVTVSDHIQREIREVTIEGMFTNHPMKGYEDVSKVSISGTGKALQNRALIKFNELTALADKKEPVRLVCSLAVYPKMVITEIDYDRDAKSGSSIRFSMTLREIMTVDLKTAKSSYNFQPENMDSANNKRIASKAKSGKRAAEEKAANEMKNLLKVEVMK